MTHAAGGGGAALERSGMPAPQRETLLEAASARASFHPRFVTVRLVGVAELPHAALPAMDRGGLADVS